MKKPNAAGWMAHADELERLADRLESILHDSPCGCARDCPRCEGLRGMMDDIDGEARKARQRAYECSKKTA